MEQIKKIYVSIQFDAEEIEVGELVSENKLIYFKYLYDVKNNSKNSIQKVIGR
jgi:hypothetical protein